MNYMELYEQIDKVKQELGIDLNNIELSDAIDYLKKHTNLFLIDLYSNEEKMKEFEIWKFNKDIRKQKVFVVIYKNNKMQIDYTKVEKYKVENYYLYEGAICHKDNIFLNLKDAEKSLKHYRSGYIYTEKTIKYIKQRKCDFREMSKVYYGTSILDDVWYQKIKELENNKKIEQIYEVYTKGFAGAWYLVRDDENNRYIVKHRINDVNTKVMMSEFLKNNPYVRIESNELDILKYDLNPKQKYTQMISDFKIEFKNIVLNEYYKCNLGINDNIEKFLKDKENLIEDVIYKYLEKNPEFSEDEELKKAFINHFKFELKCILQDDFHSLDFLKENYLINKNNIKQFDDEFTKKIIYGEKEEETEEL